MNIHRESFICGLPVYFGLGMWVYVDYALPQLCMVNFAYAIIIALDACLQWRLRKFANTNDTHEKTSRLNWYFLASTACFFLGTGIMFLFIMLMRYVIEMTL